MENIEAYCEKLFEYMRCILFEETYEDLDPSEAPNECKKLCQGLLMLSVWMKEYRDFSNALASGDLNTKAPDVENPIVWPIKALRSNLLHLTWQTQQVAKGNYSQKVNFLGDFSNAFNDMIAQLSQKQKQINKQIENAEKREKALTQSNELFMKITEYIEDMIVIYDLDNKKIVFENDSAKSFNNTHSREYIDLMDKILSYEASKDVNEIPPFEIEVTDKKTNTKSMSFSISMYPMEWKKHLSYAYIIKDLTMIKSKTQYMEHLAFTDTLTGLYNRRYYTITLKNWMEERDIFCVCLIDLDGLKSVNDSLGHIEGDNYLKSLAAIMKQSFRRSDMLFRLGGDEFVVLLDNVNEEQANTKMKFLYEKFLSTSSKYPKSLSYGICEVAKGKNTLSINDIIEKADHEMYEQKKAKRSNRK